MESNAYQDLKAWKRGMALVDEVYKLARTFPESEFEQEDSVGNRLKRAVIAIPAKIANGYGRGSRAGYLGQLRVARRNLATVEEMLAAAVEQGLATEEQTAGSKRAVRGVGIELERLIHLLSGTVCRN